MKPMKRYINDEQQKASLARYGEKQAARAEAEAKVKAQEERKKKSDARFEMRLEECFMIVEGGAFFILVVMLIAWLFR